MTYEFTPLVIPFALSAGCLFVPWYFARRISDRRTVAALVLWTLPVVVWAVAVMLRLSATTLSAERTWHSVRFVGPAFGSVGYFLFTAAYTSHTRWFRRRRLLGLACVPVLTTLLALTNAEHMLLRATIERAGTGPFVMAYTPGPWFVIHVLYSYALVLIGTAWLVRRFREHRSHVFFEGQIGGVLLGVLIVVATNVSFNAGVTEIDWTPVAGAVSAVLIAATAVEYRFLDVAPLARETVIENMDDGIVVTDTDGRIVDANGRAGTVLNTGADRVVGSAIGEVFVTPTETIEEVIAGSNEVAEDAPGTRERNTALRDQRLTRINAVGR
jgi:PAS domain-containing protein